MKSYKFELTEQEVQIIGSALSELPYKVSAALLVKLQGQVNDQDKVLKKDKND